VIWYHGFCFFHRCKNIIVKEARQLSLLANEMNDTLAPFLALLYTHVVVQAVFVTYGACGALLDVYSLFLHGENKIEKLYNSKLMSIGGLMSNSCLYLLG